MTADGKMGELHQVAAGTFAYLQRPTGWWVNNVGVVIGEDHVVLVDTCATERRTTALRRVLEQAGWASPRFIVSTHEHGDHTNGNSFFPEAAVLAHPQSREGILATSPGGREETYGWIDWGQLEKRPPDITVQSDARLHLGGVDVWVKHPGPAHTRGDLIVAVTDRACVFAGDLVFNGSTPFALMGSVRGWVDALAVIRDLAPETVVPGHGPPGGLEILDETEAYLEWLLEVADRGHSRGVPPVELARGIGLGRFVHLAESERLVGNLWAAYAELEGRVLGPPDWKQAMADMVQFNGGRPLASPV